jgi:hypothetical protein
MKLGVFILGGIILIASGILQVVVRPRADAERGPARFINGATVRAVMFVTVGVLAILVGMGVIPLASLNF